MLEVTMRVATRHVIANKLRDNLRETFDVFRRRMDAFESMWSPQDVRGQVSNPNPYIQERMQIQLETIIHYGRALADWAVDTRAIPRDKVKTFELAVRCVSTVKIPRQPATWWIKNQAYLEVLASTIDWPERGSTQSDVQEVFDVAGLRVHNTLHLEGEKLRVTHDVVEKVTRQISRHSKFSRIVYGDVFVVGQLAKSKRMAWYDINTDRVYLRPHLKFGPGDVQNLTHEFGHRFWYKFMPKTDQAAWRQVYRDVQDRGGATPIEMPAVGEPFPIAIRGLSEPPIVTKIENYRFYLDSGGFVPYNDVRKILRTRRVVSQFPTPYSAQDPEEFFAESFALYILGNLTEPHRTSFETVVGL